MPSDNWDDVGVEVDQGPPTSQEAIIVMWLIGFTALVKLSSRDKISLNKMRDNLTRDFIIFFLYNLYL